MYGTFFSSRVRRALWLNGPAKKQTRKTGRSEKPHTRARVRVETKKNEIEREGFECRTVAEGVGSVDGGFHGDFESHSDFL